MKNLFIIAAAVAAMAACTKSSVVYDDSQNEIGFIPVSDVVSKAVPGPIGVDGTGSSQSYNQKETFGIFAYHNNNAVADTEWNAFYPNASLYIDNKEFVYREDLLSFAGRNPEYWPKTGSLAFAGYSPWDMLNDKVSYTADATPVFKINNFTQGNYEWPANADNVTNNTVDVMWFDVDDQNSASQNDVAVVFKHALAWLDFNVKLAEDVAAESFTIKSIVLTNMYLDGSFTTETTPPTWSPATGALKEIVLYDNSTGNNITTTGTTYGELLVIPQNIVKVASTTKSQLRISYTQNTSDGTAQVETIVLDIEKDDIAAWELGKHYTYNISFSLNEIEVQPAVMDWTVQDGGSITVGGNN